MKLPTLVLRRYSRFVLVAVIGAFWGSEWIITRGIDLPLQSLAIRQAFAAVLLLAVSILQRRAMPDGRLLLLSAISGATALSIPAILIVYASERISPGLLILVLAMTPLIAALVEGRARGTLLGALTGGIAGTALLVSQALSFSAAQWLGGVAALASATLVAGSLVLIKRRLLSIGPVAMSAIQFCASALLLWIVSLATEGPVSVSLTSREWVATISLAMVGSAIAWPVYCVALRDLEPFQLSSSQWVGTLTGLVEGFAVVRGEISWRTISGAAILVLNLAGAWRARDEEDEAVTILITPST